jgi:Fur family ferric uptake transcriptional regulator
MSERRIREELELFYSYLRQNGLKKTYQKELILETFLNTEGHLSVEDVYSLVKRRDKRIGIVTVFRTLKSLTACGIAREITLGDGLTRFEHSYHHPHHHHIVCMGCHRTIEFVSPDLERIQQEIVAKYSFHPIHHRLQIYGTCEDCREHRTFQELPKCDTEKIFARDAVKMALCMEKRGVEFFRAAAGCNLDPSGREVFERVAHEGTQHLEELERELFEIYKQDKVLEKAPMFLHFDPCELERLIPDLQQYRLNGELRLNARQSLDAAMVLGQRAANFFKDYAEKFLETEGKRVFQRFAEEEMRHLDLIRRRREETVMIS